MAKFVTFGDTIIDVCEIAYMTLDLEKDYKGMISKYMLCITFKGNSVQHRIYYDPSMKQSMIDSYIAIKAAMLEME